MVCAGIAGALAVLALTLTAGRSDGRVAETATEGTNHAEATTAPSDAVTTPTTAEPSTVPDSSLPADPSPGSVPASSVPATTAPPPPVTDPPTTMSPVQPGPDGTVPAPLGPAPTWFGSPILFSNRVFVFGDSVILGTRTRMPAALADWDVVVDAEESRFEHEAPEILRRRRGEIGRVAVILMGHNSGGGYNHEPWIRGMIDELAGVERIVFLTAVEWGPGPAEFNQTLRRVAPDYPNVVVADWNTLSQSHPDYTFDGLHLSGAGQQALCELVATYVGPLPPPA